MFRIGFSKIWLAMLALVLGTGHLQAATLAANPTSLTLNCDTVGGPVAGTIGITLVAAGSFSVTASSSSAAVTVSGSATQTVNSTTVAKNFSFTMAAGCANATNNQQVTLTFAPTGGTNLTVTATLHITSPPIAVSGGATSINLYCDTQLGPTTATVGILLAASGSAINVTPSATLVSNGNQATFVTMSPSVATSVGSTTQATAFTFTLPAGCKNTTNGQQVALKFTPASGSAVTVTATEVITSTTSGLAPSPASVALTCTGSGSSFQGSSQTVKVYSSANLGTPFTIASQPAGITVSSLSGGTATSTPISFDVSVTATQCQSLPVGNNSLTLHLVNTPAPDKLLTVNVQVGTSPVLQASPTSVSLNYTVVAGTVGTLNSSSVGITTQSGTAYFLVDPATIPLWLNVTPTSSPASTSSTAVTFAVTAGAETLSVGVYTANVHFKVSGAVDLVVPVTLHVQNPTAQLTTVEGNTRTVYWTLGTALPTVSITPVSTDSPIAYSVTTTQGTLHPSPSPTTGIAYNFGSTPVVVTFDPLVFAAFAPGSTPLAGTVNLVGANGAGTVHVTITVYAVSPSGGTATLSGISPATLPTATSGTYTVVLSGAGFLTSGGSAAPTQVGVVTGGGFVLDPNISATVVNSTSIILAITVPPNDPNLPFNTGGPVTLGVCNPQGSACSSATGTVTLTIGANPIIQGVTSGSSYLQAAPPALTPVAPYDVVSIFGQNFCMSGGTGCTGPNAILYGQIDPVTLRYLTTLSPDSASAGAQQRNVTVTFQTHGANPTAIATAPLLFATNNQINVLVPSAVAGSPSYVGQTVDIVVSFGAAAAPLNSTPYSVTIANTDPGMFTTGGDGQGDAAALAANYSLIGSANPAHVLATAGNSDLVNLYVTGLGVPDSDGTGTCMAASAYWANVNSVVSPVTPLTSDDGLVMNSAWYTSAPNTLPPCFQTATPGVKIGGVAGNVVWAGWAPSSVAGLYQIQVRLPASGASYHDASNNSVTVSGTSSTPVALPITISTASGAVVSQSGVDLYVVKGLTASGIAGTINGTVSSGALTGTPTLTWDGTATYTYSYSTTLPGNVSISIDGTSGVISAVPTQAGDATIVVTVTDHNGLKGTVTLNFHITA